MGAGGHEATALSRSAVSGQGPARWRSHIIWLLPLGLIFAPTAHWLWQRWTMSVWHNSHGLLVPFMVAYLVGRGLRSDRTGEEEASAWGFLFLVPAFLLVIADSAIKTQLLSAVGLVLCLPGLSFVLLGARRTRRLVVAWILALGMLPIPAAFAQPILMLLRRVSAAGAAEVLSLLGIPVLREDTTLYLSDQSLLIADSCSGFSAMYGSITIALLLACLVPSRMRGLLVIAISVPSALICNILRCVALALMVHGRGVELLETSLHSWTGVAAFGLTTLVLIAAAGLSRAEEAAA